MQEPTFDIFAGETDKNAVWVEAVAGLSNARERMEQIAAEKPGRYFLFSCSSHTILLRIETSRKADSAGHGTAA